MDLTPQFAGSQAAAPDEQHDHRCTTGDVLGDAIRSVHFALQLLEEVVVEP
jgi:hypothetical protein